MKKFRLTALLLALVMVLSLLAGCGGKEETPAIDNVMEDAPVDSGLVAPEKEEPAPEVPEAPEAPAVPEAEEEKLTYTQLPAALTAEKIGSVECNYIYPYAECGTYYRGQNGLYGVMSFDGTVGSEPIYASCSSTGSFFTVSTTPPENVADIAGLNSFGVVDATGREVVPMKYAAIRALNERFIRVVEVTEQTTNQDEALVFYSQNQFAIFASEDDTFFKGVWYIYDAVTGQPVPGATGTMPYTYTAYGDFVKYVTDAQEQMVVNAAGQALPAGADLFSNGYYALESGSTGTVYDADGNQLFTYDPDGFVPTDSEGDYLRASNYNEGKYALMDMQGNLVSAEFDDYPWIYGQLLLVEDQVYDLAGNKVMEGSFERVSEEELTGQAWILEGADGNFTLLKKDGTVIYQGAETDTLAFDKYTTFSVEQKTEDENLYYCLADGDFTVKGRAFAPWLVRVSQPDYIYDLVDLLSGQTLLAGYEGYNYVLADEGMYIYAETDTGVDIYLVK